MMKRKTVLCFIFGGIFLFFSITLCVWLYIEKIIFTPAFSVVLTTYNRAEHLPNVIASVLNQTFDDFEFLILDDGSTDNTSELLQSYYRRDSRIKLLKNKENKGIPYSRNKLLKAARGKFITIVDSDDIMYLNLLEKVSDYLTQHPDKDIIYGNHLISWDEKGCVHPMRNKWPILIFENNIIQNSGVTFRRDFVEKHKISYDLGFSVAEDYDFWLQMIMKGARVGYIDQDLICYERLEKTGKYYYDIAHFRFESLKRLYRFLKMPDTKLLPLCETARKFHEMRLPFLSEWEWNKEFYLYCAILPKETEVKLKHKKWSGTLAINENKTRGRRLGHFNEWGDIIEFTDDKLVVRWEIWGKETFIRNKYTNVYVIQE